MLDNRVPLIIVPPPLSERDLHFLASMVTRYGLEIPREAEAAIDLQLQAGAKLYTRPAGLYFEDMAVVEGDLGRVDDYITMNMETLTMAIARIVTLTSKAALAFREKMERREGEVDGDYFHRIMMAMEFGLNYLPPGSLKIQIRPSNLEG